MTAKFAFHWLPFLLISLLIGGCTSEQAAEEVQFANPTAVLVAPTNTAAISPSPASTLTEPTTLPPAPTKTATPVDSPTAEPQPQPTPTLVPVDGTLVLYAKIVAVQTSPDPADLWVRHYAFRTLPELPFLDPAIFDVFYGKSELMEPIGMFFFDFRPQPSPDGRYVLVPGLVGYPQYGVEGTGTWLLDLQMGETRKLLPDGVTATWSPTSDAITYVKDGTLYTLDIAAGATPNPLLQDEKLWPLYAKWSPDGRTIATLISIHGDPASSEDPQYFAAPWLVPVNGEPARQLPVLEVFGMEYVSEQMSWSPDGQYLLVHNEIFDLEGNLVSPDYQFGVRWMPTGTQLLARGDGLWIMTIAGEPITQISTLPIHEWAFSHDGRYLAYAHGAIDGPPSIAVYDLEEDTSRTILSHSASPIRWSADDRFLILGTYGGDPGARPQITIVGVDPPGEEKVLIDYAELIEVVAYPPPAPVDIEAVTPAADPSATPTTPSNANRISYNNADYGFSFRYPEDSWTLIERPQDPNLLSLAYHEQGIALRIRFKRLGEEGDLQLYGGAAGEFIERGTVHFLGEDVGRSVVVYEDIDRAVHYNGTRVITRGDLQFTLALVSNRDYERGAVVPEAVQAEADRILETFAIVSPTP